MGNKIDKAEKSGGKIAFLTSFSLGVATGYKGIPHHTHILYGVLLVLTLIYSGGISNV